MQYKVIIWGVGSIYNKHVNVLRYFENLKEIEVTALTTKETYPFQTVDGYPLIKCNDLNTVPYDYIIVMSDTYFYEIVHLAMKNGASRNQIIPYRILDIPSLSFNRYIELKESNISILANNCWGGLVYHTLGMECLSPFKNLFLEDDDYIRLLNNLDYYLKCKLTFVQYKEYKYTKQTYPIMRLDDVMVHCLHYNTPEDAIHNWSRRCLKINYENLFVEMYTEKENIMNQFLLLSKYEKKVCFTSFNNPGKAYKLDLYPGQTWFWESLNTNATNEANSLSYNIIDLLSSKKAERFTR